MSLPDNPYQSPQTAEAVYQAEMVDSGGLWRKGSLLVMHKMAPLPDRCVKSNVPTQRRLKRSLSWHHPLIFLTLLISLLIYVILALVLRKTAKIHIGLSDEWFARRRRAMVIGWTTVLVSLGMIIGGITMVDSNGLFGLAILAGAVLFVAGAIYGLLGARMVAPTRISDTHIWLKGVCPEFLVGLPDWPHTP